MRKTIAAAVIALVIPSLAAAAGGKPTNPGKSNAAHTKAKVMYVVKGKVTAYTAAGTANGSITLTVTGANHHARMLKGQSVTFAVSTATKIAPKTGVTVGDNAVVKVRLPKSTLAADLVATLAATASFQIVDQRPSSTSDD